MTRLARALVLTAITVASLIVAPASAPALGRPCAAGELHVAVIVDFGTGSSVNMTCVPAASRDNGAQLLGARASVLGTVAPRFNVSGLLCAIDNVPVTGCGERTSGHYAYWSYWRGTNGTWVYSNSGPASQRVQADVVEGWRFQPSGAGNPSDPPPRASAYRRCAPTPASTAPPATVAPAPPPASVGGASAPAVPPTSALPRRTGAGVGGAPPTARPPTAGTTTSAAPRRGAASTTATTATSARADAAAAEPGGSKGSGGSGVPAGLIVGVLLVAALGGAGALAARRRRAAGP